MNNEKIDVSTIKEEFRHGIVAGIEDSELMYACTKESLSDDFLRIGCQNYKYAMADKLSKTNSLITSLESVIDSVVDELASKGFEVLDVMVVDTFGLLVDDELNQMQPNSDLTSIGTVYTVQDVCDASRLTTPTAYVKARGEDKFQFFTTRISDFERSSDDDMQLGGQILSRSDCNLIVKDGCKSWKDCSGHKDFLTKSGEFPLVGSGLVDKSAPMSL